MNYAQERRYLLETIKILERLLANSPRGDMTRIVTADSLSLARLRLENLERTHEEDKA
jgi:hypothetical protein